MSDTSGIPTSVPLAIVGAGPVGLSLAVGLAHHEVRSVIFEKNASISRHSKAAGIHIRTRETFRQWGIEKRFMEAGFLKERLRLHNAAPGRSFYRLWDFSELDIEADQPGLLMLEQSETERILLNIVRESNLSDVYFETEAVKLCPHEDGATLIVKENNNDREVQADFVVGCDGASSFVRDALNLPFEGTTYAVRPTIADVTVNDTRDTLPWPRLRNCREGLTVGLRLHENLWRIIHLSRDGASHCREVRDAKVQSLTHRVLGTGEVDVVWASRFRIHRRSSPRFRAGRVLLAGDAAHVHSPVGGQGMNAGIQDAHNLAWKLAGVLDGGDTERLLNSYETERQAVVVEDVSQFTDVVTRLFLQAPPIVREAAFLFLRTIVKIPSIRYKAMRRMAMLDLDYPASELLNAREISAGVRLPNPVLHAPDGQTCRLYDLLPRGAALIRVGSYQRIPHDFPVEEVIHIGAGSYLDPSGLIHTLLQRQDGWIAVRPDAHVAWARTTLEDASRAVYDALGISVRGKST